MGLKEKDGARQLDSQMTVAAELGGRGLWLKQSTILTLFRKVVINPRHGLVGISLTTTQHLRPAGLSWLLAHLALSSSLV